jgi:hypothetical protein
VILKAPAVRLLLAVLSMAVIAYCDANTDEQISLWPLYVIPVCLVSSRFGFPEGAVAACVAGLLLLIAARFSGHPYSGHLYFLFATLGQVVALIVVAWYAARLAAAESILKKILSVKND